MLNSTVLEVAIGLVFCYASIALIVSSIHEAIASMLKLRSGALLHGVKSLINDPDFNGLALKIYNHALVNPCAPGTADSKESLLGKPSYIEPKHFAVALVDAVGTMPNNFKQLAEDIREIQDPQLKQLLEGMYERSSGSIESLHAQVAAWFDSGMDRVSGKYKRQSQLFCFLIAFAVAALFNVDSFHLFKALWEHPAVAAQISTLSSQNAIEAVNQLDALKTKDLPIGWKGSFPTNGDGIVVIAGWLVTASATLFGAPFWFDLLQQLIRLRGTGSRPNQGDKTESTASPAQVIVTVASQAPPQNTAATEGRNAMIPISGSGNEKDDGYNKPESRSAD